MAQLVKYIISNVNFPLGSYIIIPFQQRGDIRPGAFRLARRKDYRKFYLSFSP